jgi:hypothetical protein
MCCSSHWPDEFLCMDRVPVTVRLIFFFHKFLHR